MRIQAAASAVTIALAVMATSCLGPATIAIKDLEESKVIISETKGSERATSDDIADLANRGCALHNRIAISITETTHSATYTMPGTTSCYDYGGGVISCNTTPSIPIEYATGYEHLFACVEISE